MKKTRLFLMAVAVTGMVAQVVWASAAKRLSFDQLVSGSDRVVVAKLEKPGKSAWGPERRRIYTTYTFEVVQDVAGSGTGQITIVQPGGRVGRLAQKTEGYPTFEPGKKTLLFLREKRGAFRVVGLCQGVFDFRKEDEREFVVQRLKGLSFPGDHGRPILIERKQAFEKIRARWSHDGQVTK